MVPRSQWKIYKFKGKDLSRKIVAQSQGNTRYLTLRYFHDNIETYKGPAGRNNCLFTEHIDTRSPYNVKMDEDCECYKLLINGKIFFILTSAFDEDYYNSHLNQITELPESMISHTGYTFEDVYKSFAMVSTITDKLMGQIFGSDDLMNSFIVIKRKDNGSVLLKLHYADGEIHLYHWLEPDHRNVIHNEEELGDVIDDIVYKAKTKGDSEIAEEIDRVVYDILN